MEVHHNMYWNTADKVTFNGLSFEDWKKTCRAMWLLDEIEYGVEESGKDKKLMVGKWNGPYGSGIVYCRRKNESQVQRY